MPTSPSSSIPQSGSAALPDALAARWYMAAIVSAGFFCLTLNWFNVAPAFPLMAVDLGVGIPELALLISLFVVGYGIAHIPAGMVLTRLGLKRTLVLGVLLQGLAGVTSGIAPDYALLATSRVIAGIGASIFVAAAYGALVVWFEGRQLALALGIAAGVWFSVGIAVGLYVWVFVQAAVGWNAGLVIGGLIGIAVAVVTAAGFRTPPGAVNLSGVTVTTSGLRKALLHRDLWIYGIALLGAYGAYFTASQLLSDYAVTQHGFSPASAGLLVALIGLAGIPGSIVGGYWADRISGVRGLAVIPLVVNGLLLLLIPVAPGPWLWAIGIAIGFFQLLQYAAWASVPALVARTPHEHLGTAIGLMFTLAAIGGFIVPFVFGQIVPVYGWNSGWVFLGVISVVFACVGFVGRNASPKSPSAA
ncbi:MFS transporter [Pseudonocardia abyssalis]|uniref:MFS transporter n=1 Tax=Pseudonocardia abyssalis TaxID=2792008 RepID=A0ABS6UYS9_9PSEU|nr:MFS transporter [Pseudonocardia abyssalis]MBW0115747.1 MFS transporter [Pseudonocardia abyssalis]MBW0137420.1 MFS transporter [Pseudonocardia abyssalis]